MLCGEENGETLPRITNPNDAIDDKHHAGIPSWKGD
jgi:hypothetical protein